jgi:hypothetical protein
MVADAQTMGRQDDEPGSDPVIEALKREVDYSLLAEMLKLTPEQRFQRMESAIQFARECRRAVESGRNSLSAA